MKLALVAVADIAKVEEVPVMVDLELLLFVIQFLHLHRICRYQQLSVQHGPVKL
jgi:hypothetical protein